MADRLLLAAVQGDPTVDPAEALAAVRAAAASVARRAAFPRSLLPWRRDRDKRPTLSARLPGGGRVRLCRTVGGIAGGTTWLVVAGRDDRPRLRIEAVAMPAPAGPPAAASLRTLALAEAVLVAATTGPDAGGLSAALAALLSAGSGLAPSGRTALGWNAATPWTPPTAYVGALEEDEDLPDDPRIPYAASATLDRQDDGLSVGIAPLYVGRQDAADPLEAIRQAAALARLGVRS